RWGARSANPGETEQTVWHAYEQVHLLRSAGFARFRLGRTGIGAAATAAPEARQLLSRAGHGEAQEPAVQQLASCVGVAHATDRIFLPDQSSRCALDAGAAAGLIGTPASRLRFGANGDTGRRLAAVVERRAGEAGDLGFRAWNHRPIEPELRLVGGPYRGVRSGWHALGRASHVHASDLLPGTRSGGGGEAARTQERRAVQDRALRQPRGDGEAFAARPRENPRCDVDWYVRGRIQRRSKEVARNRARSTLEAAVYRARLSADARSAALPT